MSKINPDEELYLDSGNKDKRYGGYYLEERYVRTLLFSFLVSALVLLALLLMAFIAQDTEKKTVTGKQNQEENKEEIIELIDIPLQTVQTLPPPKKVLPVPQEKPSQPKQQTETKIKTVKFVPLEAAINDEEVTEPAPPSQVELKNTTASDKYREGVEDSTGTAFADQSDEEVQRGSASNEDKPWVGLLTKEVNFPGGVRNYINDRISQKLREYVKDYRIKGQLYVTVIIGKNGNVKTVDIPTGKEIPGCKLCTEEITQILKDMPAWTPAEYNGTPVMRKIAFPVIF